MPDTALVFNALNGFEMKAAILAKIDEALERSGEFAQNMTFPWVKLTFSVGLTVYPKQDAGAAPGIVVTGSQESEGAPDSLEEALKKTIEVCTTEVIDTPDLTRIETNQPIPTPTVGAGGVIVDKPVVPPSAKANSGQFPAKEKNSGSGNTSSSPSSSK